ncbi:MAG: NHLP bacteriocin system secretion protein [Proteobacteria bacterium]|nr:NHLP bacteriocin system secretion protein [Pseudomonadota bacterium]
MADQIFRKVALERLSSPEQLDQLMRITTPKGWVALIAAMGLLACAIFWGFWGTIPDKVAGQGILMKSGGVFKIVSNSAGRVQNLYFSVDDIIHSGQIVARLEQPEILDRIKSARAVLQELLGEREQIAVFGSNEMKLERESMSNQKANLNRTIATLKVRIKYLENKIESQKVIMDMGLITKQQMMDTQEELNNTRQQNRENLNKLQQISIRKLQLKNQQEKDLRAMEQKISEARRNIDQLQNDLNDTSKVVSPYTGRILEIAVDEGSVVGKGIPLISIELIGKNIKNLEAVLYFPPRQGKKIRLGMAAQISPSTVKQEKYGFIRGMVTYVSEFPSTHQGMMRDLQNEALVQNLSQGGAPIEVRADLIPDPRTPSGYKWSSSNGPPIKVNTGTLCYSSVTISEQRPVSLIVPMFKKSFLGVGKE